MLNSEELKYINTRNKEYFYGQYLNTNDVHKEYHKITRRQMLEAIYRSISTDTVYLQRTVLKEDLVFLKENITKNQFIIERNKRNTAHVVRLYQAFLLFDHDYFNDEYVIPTEVRKIFEHYDLTKLNEELDNFYYFLNGLLLVRGKVTMNEAEEIYKSVKSKHAHFPFSEGKKWLDGSLFSLDQTALEMTDLLIKYTNYFAYEINAAYPAMKYTYDDYYNYGKYGLNLNDTKHHKLYEIISEQIDNDYLGLFIEDFLNSLHAEPGAMNQWIFRTLLAASADDFTAATELYNELIKILPRWDFKGIPHGRVKNSDVAAFYNHLRSEESAYDDTCPCGSGLDYENCCGDEVKLRENKAILAEDKVKLLYGFINSLVIYANFKHNKFAVDDFDTFLNNLSQEDYGELKEVALADSEIIHQFKRENKNLIAGPGNEIIVGIQKSYKQFFYALEYLDQKLIIYDEENKVKIALSGVVSPLCESVSGFALPLIIETRLIPLNDRITYDIMLSKIGISLGPNIKKSIYAEALDAPLVTNINEFEKYILKR